MVSNIKHIKKNHKQTQNNSIIKKGIKKQYNFNKFLNQILNDNTFRKNKIYSILIFLIFISIISTSYEETNIITVYMDSSSTNMNFIGNGFSPMPTQILINGQELTPISTSHTFSDPDNTIKLIWNTDVTICNSMFISCQMKKVDLSEFNLSNVVDMTKMFSLCSKLEEVIISNNPISSNNENSYIDLSKVTSMNSMFSSCIVLTSLNFSRIKAPSLVDMTKMFYGCSKLVSLDFSYFDATQVTSLYYFCYNCGILLNINFTNSHLSSIENIGGIFYNCKKLLYLDLTTFNLSEVTNAVTAFCQCIDLKEIKFNQIYKMSKITSTKKMFQTCKNITSLDLSFIDTSNVNDMDYMFNNCYELQYLNIPNFNTTSVTSATCFFVNTPKLKYINGYSLTDNEKMNSNFNDLPEGVTFCINEGSTTIISNLENKGGINDCSTICTLFNQKSIPSESSKCYSSCIHDELYHYEHNNICYLECPTNTRPNIIDNVCEIYDDNEDTTHNINLDQEGKEEDIEKELEKEKESILEKEKTQSLEKEINEEEETKEKEEEKPEEENKETYTEKSKETIPEEENNNDYPTEKLYDSIISSFSSSEIKKNSYESIESKIISTENNDNHNSLTEQPEVNTKSPEKSTEIIEIVETISENLNIDDIKLIYENCSIINFLNKLCNMNDNNNEINEVIINKIRINIKEKNIKEILEKIIGNDKEEYLIQVNNSIHQLTSSYNQDNKNYNNISTINLGECEGKLKSANNITENLTLIIYKIDTYEEGLLMPIIEYEVFNPITYEKLNLDVCKNKVKVSYPININEDEIYKYNISSDYYQDKCSPTKNNNNFDIIIKDRQDEYIKNNYSLCENDCDFIGYDNENKKAICECDIKNEINFIKGYKIDKNKLLKKFKDFKSMLNLYVLKCWKIFFTKKGFTKNIGNYVLLFSLFYYIVSSMAFCCRGFNFFEIQINKIKNLKKFGDLNTNKIEMKPNQKVIKQNKKDNKGKKRSSKTKNKFEPSKKKSKSKSKKNSTDRKSIKSISYNNKSKFSSSSLNIYKKQETKNENNQITYINLNDYELNNLSYNEALIYDKRTYWQYYISLLKTKHLILFTFCNHKDYNSIIIKICLFLFVFVLSFTINALFYTDNTIHDIYENSGVFDFMYHIPQIIYSTVISVVINLLIKLLSLSQKNILKIKNEKNTLDYENKIKSCLRCLKIKFILFFILSFIFLIVFWFYLGCFCAVYHNTQIHVIKDTVYSFCLSLIYPLFINLIPGLIRIPSLKDEKGEKNCAFNISKIIQLI